MAKSDFWFSFPFRVRCSEVDFQGVVFNAHYLTYFDTAITEYFRWLPYDLVGYPRRTGMDFHIVRALVEFTAPSRFDDDIAVHVRTARIGRSSITFALEVFAEDGDDRLVSGEIVWVNTDQQNRTSAPVPDELADLIRSVEGGRIAG